MLDPPGKFTYRDGVAVIQIVAFSVLLILGSILCKRHGFRRDEGWIILVTFSLLRLLAASFQLASIKHPTNSVYGGALICQGIGLAPLTLLNIALFIRVNRFAHIIHDKVYSVISLICIGGIVTAIYGGTMSADSDTLSTNALLKASVICFVGGYACFFILFLVFLSHYREIPAGERKLLHCFAVNMPFMALRFIYGIVGTYSTTLRPKFSVLTGDVTTFLCMAVLEEIVVAGCFAVTGMCLGEIPLELRAKPKKKRMHKRLRTEEDQPYQMT